MENNNDGEKNTRRYAYKTVIDTTQTEIERKRKRLIRTKINWFRFCFIFFNVFIFFPLAFFFLCLKIVHFINIYFATVHFGSFVVVGCCFFILFSAVLFVSSIAHGILFFLFVCFFRCCFAFTLHTALPILQ